ncbi:MAG: hypothetical protein IPH69_01855 [Bacteroidales bacterium]|nr:hypothetical protein [Bacteroidales bacterium]
MQNTISTGFQKPRKLANEAIFPFTFCINGNCVVGYNMVGLRSLFSEIWIDHLTSFATTAGLYWLLILPSKSIKTSLGMKSSP